MKVKALIELLQNYEEDAEVVLQGDDEGNFYRNIRGADEDFRLEFEDDDEFHFLSSYDNIDEMAVQLGEDVSEVACALQDLVVIDYEIKCHSLVCTTALVLL